MSKPNQLKRSTPETKPLILHLLSGEEEIVNLPIGADASIIKAALLQQELFKPAGIKTGGFRSHDELRYLSIKMVCGKELITKIRDDDKDLILTTAEDGKIDVGKFIISAIRHPIPQIAFNIAAKLERRSSETEVNFSDKELEYLKELKDVGIAKVFLQFDRPVGWRSSVLIKLEALKGNQDIILEAVRQDGTALRFASDELKQDREIVLAAAGQDGTSIRFASDELRKDPEIALAAVTQDGFAIKYVQGELRNNLPLALAAVTQNYRASTELQRQRAVKEVIQNENNKPSTNPELLQDGTQPFNTNTIPDRGKSP